MGQRSALTTRTLLRDPTTATTTASRGTVQPSAVPCGGPPNSTCACIVVHGSAVSCLHVARVRMVVHAWGRLGLDDRFRTTMCRGLTHGLGLGVGQEHLLVQLPLLQLQLLLLLLQ